jgi:hypothetical protein
MVLSTVVSTIVRHREGSMVEPILPNYFFADF